MSDRWKRASRNSLALNKFRLVAFPLLLLIVGIKMVTWQHWARWATITTIIAIVVVMLAATALLVKVVPSRTTGSTGELTSADERDLRARDPQKFRIYAKTQLRASVVVLVAGIVLFFVIPDHWRQVGGWHTRWDGLLLVGAAIATLIQYGWRMHRTPTSSVPSAEAPEQRLPS